MRIPRIDISYKHKLIVIACWFEDNIILLDLESLNVLKKYKHLVVLEHLESLFGKLMNINNKKVLTEMANSIRALSIDAIENANSGILECQWEWQILQPFCSLF